MNHHTRSFSAQQPSSNLNISQRAAQPESFIRIHSDSQRSLDQLFNPTQLTGKPLRHRNLPASFFKQSLVEDQPSNNNHNDNGVFINQGSNFHSRSSSFDCRPGMQPFSGMHNRSISYGHPPVKCSRNVNAGETHHMRTHSTITPMQATPVGPTITLHAHSNSSSHLSSQEFLSHTNNINQTSTNGWSSSGYSSGDLNNGWSTNAPCPTQTFHNESSCMSQPQIIQANVVVSQQPQQATLIQSSTLQHHHHHNSSSHLSSQEFINQTNNINQTNTNGWSNSSYNSGDPNNGWTANAPRPAQTFHNETACMSQPQMAQANVVVSQQPQQATLIPSTTLQHNHHHNHHLMHSHSHAHMHPQQHHHHNANEASLQVGDQMHAHHAHHHHQAHHVAQQVLYDM